MKREGDNILHSHIEKNVEVQAVFNQGFTLVVILKLNFGRDSEAEAFFFKMKE